MTPDDRRISPEILTLSISVAELVVSVRELAKDVASLETKVEANEKNRSDFGKQVKLAFIVAAISLLTTIGGAYLRLTGGL